MQETIQQLSKLVTELNEPKTVHEQIEASISPFSPGLEAAQRFVSRLGQGRSPAELAEENFAPKGQVPQVADMLLIDDELNGLEKGKILAKAYEESGKLAIEQYRLGRNPGWLEDAVRDFARAAQLVIAVEESRTGKQVEVPLSKIIEI